MAKRRRKKEIIAVICRVALSFLFSVVLYVLVCLYNREKRVVAIPLEVVVSEAFDFESNVPSEINVNILGSASLIYTVNPDKIKARIDCGFVDAPGIYNVPIELDYNLGVLDSFRIEISPERNYVRLKFALRNGYGGFSATSAEDSNSGLTEGDAEVSGADGV